MSQGFTKPESAALAAHEADTTSVHGIADTALLLDTADVGPVVQPTNTERIWASPLPPLANLIITADKAVFVFVRRLEVATTPKYVELFVNSAAIGTQTAEVGLFSTPSPPNKSGQTLTKLVATGTVDDMTTTGVKRNTTAFATSIPAGTYLWAGFRSVMTGSMPTCASLSRDFGQGQALETATAGALTASSTFAGTIIAVPASTVGICAELRVVLD